MIREQPIGPDSLRRKSLSILVVALGFLAFNTTAHADDVVFTSLYTHPVDPTITVATAAFFDDSLVTGVGREDVPLVAFTMYFNRRGINQRANIDPFLPLMFARHQDGAFDYLISSGPVQVVPPANFLGETVFLFKFKLRDSPCCAGWTDYVLASTTGPCVTSTAFAALRNAGSNPVSYTVDTPVMGALWTASVDLTTTGHTFAEIRGFMSPVSTTLRGGQVLLVGGPQIFKLSARAGPLASWALAMPNDCAFLGLTVYTQAVHFGGAPSFALSNAQDLFIGY